MPNGKANAIHAKNGIPLPKKLFKKRRKPIGSLRILNLKEFRNHSGLKKSIPLRRCG
jgi:hypothetical protein